MFGFGKKKQTVLDEHGQPLEGQESAKGGLFQRLFGARDDSELGWVPGLGPLGGSESPAETQAETQAETTAVSAPVPEVASPRPDEPVGESVRAPVREPVHDEAGASAAPVAPALPPAASPTAAIEAPVPVASAPSGGPSGGPAGPDLAPPPARAPQSKSEPVPAFPTAPAGAAQGAADGGAAAPKTGLFRRFFHRDEPPAAPPSGADAATAPPVPVPAAPPASAPAAAKPRYGLKLIEIKDEPVDWESPEVRIGLFGRLRERLSRSRSTLGSGLGNLFLGRKKIDDDLMEELETLLVTADLGMEATTRIITDLTRRVKRKALADPQALLAALKDELRLILVSAQAPVRQAAADRPQVILMVGVNGAGKTTTIGKLARYLLAEGNSVMLAAGDTFRAAAVEQLQTWGERNRVPVIAQKGGADSASVIFDALQAATARGIDVLIADTAGRLHTKSNLMDELAKIARVMKKIDPEAPHEVLLVIDATTGQNGLNQALQFHQAVPLTGIALTKLDGTAKGGIVFAIAERLKVPIRFIGVGESIEDLRPFDADEFLYALLGQQ